MKHFWKRMLAGMLTVIMLAGMMPPVAFAALWENSSSRNREILAALEAWQAPEAPAEPEETPTEPEGPTEPEETPAEPEAPEKGPAGETPEEAPAENDPGEEPEESGAEPVQMSARSVQNQAAPMVTALGGVADPDALLDVTAFLDQYGLLTDTGCLTEWGIALPGGDREIAVEELLDMVERGELADSAVVDVDGIPVTVADLKVMLEIEEYIAYLRRTYFDGHQWTQE